MPAAVAAASIGRNAISRYIFGLHVIEAAVPAGVYLLVKVDNRQNLGNIDRRKQPAQSRLQRRHGARDTTRHSHIPSISRMSGSILQIIRALTDRPTFALIRHFILPGVNL